VRTQGLNDCTHKATQRRLQLLTIK